MVANMAVEGPGGRESCAFNRLPRCVGNLCQTLVTTVFRWNRRMNRCVWSAKSCLATVSR